jgi:hypothetical protein
MPCNNQADFDRILKKAITSCIEHLSDKILECVQDHIQKDTYGSLPNKVYNNGTGNPTFEFKNAFKFEGIKNSVKEISNKLFYDWTTMSTPSQSNKYLHGNFNEGQDRRSILAELLNVNGIDGGNDWGGKERQAFWDNALKDINNKFDGWAREAYNKFMK